MTIYGTTAKIIGMYKLYLKYYTETKYIIVAKSDLDKDKYLSIILKYCNIYVNYNRYGTLFTSIAKMEINVEDRDELTKNITL
jgi:adenylate kinase